MIAACTSLLSLAILVAPPTSRHQPSCQKVRSIRPTRTSSPTCRSSRSYPTGPQWPQLEDVARAKEQRDMAKRQRDVAGDDVGAGGSSANAANDVEEDDTSSSQPDSAFTQVVDGWTPPPRRVKMSAAQTKRARAALDGISAERGSGGSTRAARKPLSRSTPPCGRIASSARPSPPARIHGLGPLSHVRSSLPVTRHRAEVLEALRAPVSIIEGDTGSGKTTQVAQFLLEEAAKTGERLRLACTQPRRISAISVAERIAEERGEPVGKRGAVGYAVRGEAKRDRDNNLLVCTVGVLLRILESDPTLAAYDVVIVDEVHERSVESDLLLLLLRRLLLAQQGTRQSAMRRKDGEAHGSAQWPGSGVRGDSLNSRGCDGCKGEGVGQGRDGGAAAAIPARPMKKQRKKGRWMTVDGRRRWVKDAPPAEDVQMAEEAHAAAIPARPMKKQRKKGRWMTVDGRRRWVQDAPPAEDVQMAEEAPEAGEYISSDALPRLRVCLMSATMDGELLEQYFGSALKRPVPRVVFGGRSFPVQTHYLEEALRITGHCVRASAQWCVHSELSRRRGIERQVVKAPAPTKAEVAERFPDSPPAVVDAIRQLDTSIINVDLIVQLLRRLVVQGARDDEGDIDDGSAQLRAAIRDGGSVLVFLPGAVEIDAVQRAVVGMLATASGRVRSQWVLPLHGALPPSEQARVFTRAPAGVCKVVLATNVAETSVTIPNVVLVIDSGRVKQMAYDPIRRVASLADMQVSKAQARQRRGRAGRVRPGACYHLFLSDATLDSQTDPEVRRVSLERLVVSTKALRLPGRASDVLAMLPEPPSSAATAAALGQLQLLGAIDVNETLTPLGHLLVELPLEPRLAKLVLLGVVFGAVDEALTIAAALSSPYSPLLSPTDNMEARCVAAARGDLAQGTHSDHIAALHAYRTYFALPVGLGGERAAYARRAQLSVRALKDMRALKVQLLELLADARLVPQRMRDLGYTEEMLWRRVRHEAAAGQGAVAASSNTYSDTPASSDLISTLVAAAFHPQLAYVSTAPARDKDGRRAPGGGRVELHIRDGDGPKLAARVHPAALGSRLNSSGWGSPYLAFHECIRTSSLFVRDATPVPPLGPLLFCGNELAACEAPGGKDLCLDGWLRVEASTSVAGVIVDARRHVLARWERMVGEAARGDSLGGRFDGQPLVDVLEPLLAQRALPDAPPRASEKKCGSAGKRAMRVKVNRRRRKRSHMARYRNDW